MESKYKNLSNGFSDGLVLFYMKDKMLHPVKITKDQAEILDFAIMFPFKETELIIESTPVKYENIKEIITG